MQQRNKDEWYNLT